MKNFNLSRWALAHQPLIRYFVVALALAGFGAYFSLGQKEDPEFTIKTMVVKVLWPGASASEVERQVTDRVEKKLQETPGLDSLRSFSKPGETTIFVNLRQAYAGKDVPAAWDRVRKDINDLKPTLPAEVQGPFFNDKFGDTFGSIYAFTADGFTPAELKAQVNTVRQELLRIPMVSKVELVGVQDEKVFVEFSTQKLATMGIDPLAITDALSAQNAMASAGTLQTPEGQGLPLRVSGDFKSVDAIREMGLRANGQSLRIGDIAEVKRGYVDPATFRMRVNGREAIGLAISMAPDGNVIKLGEALTAAMQKISAQLPAGIEVHPVSDQPAVVKAAVGEFMHTLVEAVVIVLVVSFLSLGFRTGMVVALSIPLVLAATFLAMKFLGIDLQRISLGALIIALGLLVDDAMIAVEMMAAKLEEGMGKENAASFAYTSTAFPMLTGTLITMAAFMPIGLAKSSAGEYTFSMFVVIAVALAISWLVAVVFTPWLGVMILKEGASGHGDHYDRGFYARFRRMVEWCLAHRIKVLAMTAAAFVLAVVGFGFVQQQFFPGSNRPEVIVDMWLTEGTSLSATEREVKKLEAMLQRDQAEHKDLSSYASYIGGGSPRFYLPMNPEQQHSNFAQLIIMTGGGAQREAVIARLRGYFAADFPAVRGRVSTLENGPPVGYPLQFRVTGPDSAKLRGYAEQVANAMRAHPSVRNVNSDWNEALKVVSLDIDQDKARVLGVSSKQLARSLQTVQSGISVTQYREGDELIDVVARAREEERTLLSALKDLNVPTGHGKTVPLSQLATMKTEFEDGIIWRRNRFPAITLRADVAAGSQGPDIAKALAPALKEIGDKLPLGYRIEVAGASADSAEASASIQAVLPLTLFVVVTLLMLQLQSVSRTLLVVLTAPLGIIGVTLALLASGMAFGFVAMLGVISLAGMIMRNSVILVDQIETDIADGYTPHQAIVESTVRRFRPIMLTAAAAILAMIPLVRSVFWGPMAVAIMGGLLVATVLTLFFLPALYAAWFKVDRAVPASNAVIGGEVRA